MCDELGEKCGSDWWWVKWVKYPHECDALTWIYVASKVGHLNGPNGGISVHPV